MPLKYDEIAEVAAIAREVVKEEIAKTAPKPETKKPEPEVKKPEPLTKASVGVPSDGGFMVGKQGRK